jgi:hypothetical protein
VRPLSTTGPEHEWAATNELGRQTIEMGPGARHGMLNDHINYLNFRRINCLCESSSSQNAFINDIPDDLLPARLLDALKHGPAHCNVANAIMAQHPEHSQKWSQWILDYLTGRSTNDPYEEPLHGKMDCIQRTQN